jgi:hypothetical protein
MNKSLKTLVLAIISTALLAVGAVSSPANAVSPLTVTVSKTANLALAGETVTVSVTGIPANAFVYAYQCASTTLTPRPSSLNNCVDASHAIALTNDVHFIGNQGILDGSQPQNLPLVKSFAVGSATFDCTKIECAIFIRRGEDGRGNGSDTTYDQLIPISFVKVVQKAPAIGKAVKVGKVIAFKKITSAGLLMDVKNSTPKICSVAIKGANFKVTGKKAGTCKFTLSQGGNRAANPLKSTKKTIKVS